MSAKAGALARAIDRHYTEACEAAADIESLESSLDLLDAWEITQRREIAAKLAERRDDLGWNLARLGEAICEDLSTPCGLTAQLAKEA